MAEDPGKAARATLEAARRAALDLVHGAGARRTDEILRRSARELEAKLARIAPSLGEESFTVVQLRAALAQVRHVLATITLPALRDVVVEEGPLADGRADALPPRLRSCVGHHHVGHLRSPVASPALARPFF